MTGLRCIAAICGFESALCVDGACGRADVRLRSRKFHLFGAACGTVLEIGAGSGINRRYMPLATDYLALEPEERFRNRLEVVADRVLQTCAEDIPLPDGSVDSVVSCMVLCSVADLDGTLREIYRVLKPGGMLLVVEHVAAPKGTWLRLCQRVSRPLCRSLELGCQPDRETSKALRGSRFRLDYWEGFTLRLRAPLVRDWVAARLVKPGLQGTRT
jgi:SAM-dependent methyltransferase